MLARFERIGGNISHLIAQLNKRIHKRWPSCSSCSRYVLWSLPHRSVSPLLANKLVRMLSQSCYARNNLINKWNRRELDHTITDAKGVSLVRPGDPLSRQAYPVQRHRDNVHDTKAHALAAPTPTRPIVCPLNAKQTDSRKIHDFSKCGKCNMHVCARGDPIFSYLRRPASMNVLSQDIQP